MGEYRQRLRVLEVAQEQLEAGWETAQREREAEWEAARQESEAEQETRLAAADRARVAVERRCAALEGQLGEQQDAMSMVGADVRHIHE